ncbi:uncharacterized protein LOC129613844 [Condylostylus longicornis]|uniref:uncharacterized protein LOC129613844 n=1 Tax=Condylostylus longicornis TaxID=2530218 RepID=UPI00244E043C|nr:uncharacterized protein LOC129613844 [Condylostylus longicornis]XP_055384105.1 uncharacterized protein LOC129613844 [Condylostylus longicornis]
MKSDQSEQIRDSKNKNPIYVKNIVQRSDTSNNEILSNATEATKTTVTKIITVDTNVAESIISPSLSINNETTEITNIPENVMEALNTLVETKFSTNNFKYETLPVSGRGENSYGSVLQIKIYLNDNDQVKNNKDNNEKDDSHEIENIKDIKPNDQFYCIVKISPKNEARRQTMKVVEYYQRETYVYKNIFLEYMKLQSNNMTLQKNSNIFIYDDYEHEKKLIDLKIAPILYSSSNEPQNEFLLLEDLHQSGYLRYNRKNTVTYDHVVLAIKELAKYHALSFVLRSKNPQKFDDIVNNIRTDNLFSEALSQVSVEFGKKYMKAAIKMLETENQLHSRVLKNKDKIINSISVLYDNFKEICIKLVDGSAIEPYAAICHGDFWNNNILYKYNENNIPVSAKLIDFQMARYSAPVLDLVHYLFTCTGKQLRDKYFDDFKDNYYNELANTLRNFDIDPNEIFPRLIFENQIHQHGIYGFCMACYAVPFFISDSSDLPNLDEASEAMRELSESSSDDGECDEDKDLKTTALLEEYEMLNERTTPIFKERMVGVLIDLAKYNMLDSTFLKS